MKIKNGVIATLVVVFMFGIAYHVSDKQGNTIATFVSIDEVEAIAGCEVSSNSSLNIGVCKKDVNSSNEYCVTGNGGSQCSGTV